MKTPGRILFAAPNSGSGKTLIVCAFLTILKRRGLKPFALKCGPDYIDPMFHKYVLGIDGANADSWFLSPDALRAHAVSCTKECDLAVIEGVMGYYDGISIDSLRGSSYEVGRVLDAPAVLILDGKGAAFSLAAKIKGFTEFRPESGIAGVILNRVSPMLFKRLKPVLEKETGVKLFGCLPDSDAYRIESRHLGLLQPEETKDLKERIEKAADALETCADIDAIIGLSERKTADTDIKQADDAYRKDDAAFNSDVQPVRIAVARDEAFSFYYQENLQLLKELGAELVPFSPLKDRKLPDGIAGLILGGGYPELHAEALSENESMRIAVKTGIEKGLPCLAECGGFLYLHRMLEDQNGKKHPMAAVFPFDAFKTEKKSRFGYIELTDEKGGKIRGHEYHYWESEDPGSSWRAEKPDGRGWSCIHAAGNLLAGFPHLYYLSAPSFAAEWIERCREWEKLNTRKRYENGIYE